MVATPPAVQLAQPSPEPGVEVVPQAVTDKVEAQDRYGDGESWGNHQPPRWREGALKGGAQHAAPGRVGRRYSHPQKAMEILTCPVCKGALSLDVTHEDGDEIVSGAMTCASCDEVYPIEDSIPNLLPHHLRE